MDYRTLSSNLSYMKAQYDQKKVICENLKAQNIELQSKLQSKQGELSTVNVSRDFYRKAVDLIYSRSIGEIQEVLNKSLSYIFYDKTYEVSIQLDDRWSKSLSVLLTDHDENPPVTVDIKDGVGKGVRTVASLILHVYYLLSKKAAPVLFVDEGYSYISADYLDRFFAVLNSLAKEKNFILVSITNDDRFSPFADKAYVVGDGVVKQVELGAKK